MPDYDVIIVGGRVAASTLAAYLGQANMRVLMLERAFLPQNHPASSPMIQPITMKMLDEIGADESLYAANTPPIHRMTATDGTTRWDLDIPEIGGRNYGYALDRARFDVALWSNALHYRTVFGIPGFSVTNLLWDDTGHRVVGVEGKRQGSKERERITAHCVVGADGRFSTVARKVGAKELDKHEDNPTSLYYAYWKNVKHFEDEPSTVTYAPVDGEPTHGYLLMDSADGTTAVVLEGRSDAINAPGGEAKDFYLKVLAENPYVWERLEGAEMVTKVHGMRKVGNMFREAGGNGWVLVGDAYHQKDPVDGQGIYDAVYTSRTLAKALIAWHEHRTTWDDAIAWYDKTARAKTEPQFEQTLNRVQQSLYPQGTGGVAMLPKPMLEVMSRWLAKDPIYTEAAGMALNRQIDPRTTLKPGFMMMAALRGGLRELSEQLGD